MKKTLNSPSKNVEQAKQIEGWMNEVELKWLSEQAQLHKRIVEVGSFLGRSTKALAATSGTVWAIDTFLGSPEHQETIKGRGEDFLFDAFKTNLAEEIAAGRVKPMRMTSLEASVVLANEKFDMIFIDASHDYKDVKADIAAWIPRLSPGGIICGHDYANRTSRGLEEAVRESLPLAQVVPGGSIWYIILDKMVASSEATVSSNAPTPYQNTQSGNRRKTVYTLNIGNYAPDICRLTYPLLGAAAYKWGADFVVINDRKFPDMPVNYEKFQIWDLARERGDEWSIYFDADTLINPDTFDPTEHMNKNQVMHNGADMAGNRFRYDKYFRRDGRNIGSGTWLCVCSDWTLDLWHPMEDLTLLECVGNIQPTVYEVGHGITQEHLLDDYLLSRNIAKYGLKFKSYMQLATDLGRASDVYFWHQYCMPVDEKLVEMRKTLGKWGLQIN